MSRHGHDLIRKCACGGGWKLAKKLHWFKRRAQIQALIRVTREERYPWHDPLYFYTSKLFPKRHMASQNASWLINCVRVLLQPFFFFHSFSPTSSEFTQEISKITMHFGAVEFMLKETKIICILVACWGGEMRGRCWDISLVFFGFYLSSVCSQQL